MGHGSRASSRSRPLRLLALTCLLAVAVAGLAAVRPPQADAASYRYWSYWVGGSAWTYAGQGASRVPPDGSVDGWRFVVSPATGSSKPPRASAGFQALCGDTDPVAGQKRVGVVIDYGTDDDAPPGEQPPAGPAGACVVLPPSANGYQVLAALTSLRVESGLVCGITGYPATGCAEPVEPDDDPPASSSPQPTRTSGGGSAPTTTAGASGAPATPGSSRSGTPATGKASNRSSGTPSETPTTTDPEQTEASTASELPSPLAAPAAGDDPTSGGPPAGLLAAGLVLVGLLGAAWLAARRRA